MHEGPSWFHNDAITVSLLHNVTAATAVRPTVVATAAIESQRVKVCGWGNRYQSFQNTPSQ